jgi:hypothetical protein
MVIDPQKLPYPMPIVLSGNSRAQRRCHIQFQASKYYGREN